MMIQIDLADVRQAEEISLGLSDILCWLSGYVAARPDDPELPMGREALREIAIALKDAIARAEVAPVTAATGPTYEEATEDLGEIFAVVVEGNLQEPVLMEVEARATGRRDAWDRLRSLVVPKGAWFRGCVVRLTFEGGNEAVLHEMKRLQKPHNHNT